MKAIAVFVVLIALAIGTYLNRAESHHSAEIKDTVETNLAAPVRENAIPAREKTEVGMPTNTNIPL